MKKLPMAMSSYEHMFNCCRVPKKPSDTSVKHSYKENAHIIAIRKNQFWKIPHEINGKQLNTSELELQFKRVYEKAEKAPAVGSLTSQNRDVWSDVYPKRASMPQHFRRLKPHHSSSASTTLLPLLSKSAHTNIGTATAQTAGTTSPSNLLSTRTAHQVSWASTP